MTFAVGVGITGQLTDALAEGLALALEPLIALCERELQGSSAVSDRERLAVYVRLHKERPGGRPASATSSAAAGRAADPSSSREDKYSVLANDPLYVDLYTKVQALNTTSFDVTAAILVLSQHQHPAGMIFMTSSRTIVGDPWSDISSVKAKAKLAGGLRRQAGTWVSTARASARSSGALCSRSTRASATPRSAS